jgi:hypothetical protein
MPSGEMSCPLRRRQPRQAGSKQPRSAATIMSAVWGGRLTPFFQRRAHPERCFSVAVHFTAAPFW